MLYLKSELATIVQIQKHHIVNDVRQMHITVILKKTGEEISFFWGFSPNLIFDYKSHLNKASSFFGEFWNTDDLVGKDVMLHHTKDNNYCYLTFNN